MPFYNRAWIQLQTGYARQPARKFVRISGRRFICRNGYSNSKAKGQILPVADNRFTHGAAVTGIDFDCSWRQWLDNVI
jgi:hypothetical protein